MSTHPSPDVLEAYRRGSLPWQRMRELEAHVEGCLECGVSSPSVAGAMLRNDGVSASRHLTYEELESIVDGHAVQENVSEHLGWCLRCSDDLADLRGFASTVRPRPVRRWIAAAAAVVAVAGASAFLLSRRPDHPTTAGVLPQQTDRAPAAAPASPAPAVAPRTLLVDGYREVTRDASGRIAGVPPGWEGVVERVLDGDALPAAAFAAAFPSGIERVRGTAAEQTDVVRVLSPRSLVVRDDRPSFRWQVPSGAQAEVRIYDADLQLLQTSGPVEGSSWTPDAPLPRGVVLNWEVVVSREGRTVSYPAPPDVPAMFAVAAERDLQKVREAKATGSHLVHGIALWQAGLVEEAREEFEMLVRLNPQSQIAGNLLLRARSADK